jgi:hypothetical protein
MTVSDLSARLRAESVRVDESNPDTYWVPLTRVEALVAECAHYREALEELREMTRPLPPFNPVRVAIRVALYENER